MINHIKISLIWVLGCCANLARATEADPGLQFALDPAQLHWLGERIYQNECNARPACLTAWNQGEDFPSLGIGHFIWYQRGQSAPFVETFPELLQFLQHAGVALPMWLQQNSSQPWPDRGAFLAAAADPLLAQLRTMLEQTRELQTAFIVQRFAKLAHDPTNRFATGADIRSKLQAVASAKIPYGLYALIDYVHFKGDGTSAAEQYQGQGWGLLQVLDHMPLQGSDPLQDFVTSAGFILSRRVANAPTERHEQRWLSGWQHRLQTYLPATMPAQRLP